MLDMSTDSPRMRNSSATRSIGVGPITPLPSLRIQISEHGVSQQGIGPGLVASALPPQPGDNVGVQAKSQLPLHGPIEGIADRVLPELLGQFRDIGSIDLFVRQTGEFFQSAFASSRDAAIRETLSCDFRHSACGPVPHPLKITEGGAPGVASKGRFCSTGLPNEFQN